MTGLRRLCKLHGRMSITSGGRTVQYVWDYAADEPVLKGEMPKGSARWLASERIRLAAVKENRDAD